MLMLNLFHHSSVTLGCVVAVLLGSGTVWGQQGARDIELVELKTTLETSARQIRELDAQLASAKLQVATLTQSLAAANAQSTSAQEQYGKLREVMEGLGIGALEGNRDELQNKLLTAASDLRISEESRRISSEALVSLSEASLLFAKDPTSAEARDALNSAIAQVEGIIGPSFNITGDVATDLHNTKVVSWKPEAALAVLNVGSKDGVRVGMPFTLYRDDQAIAQVVAVDVRKSVSGVVVQETLSRNLSPSVGDRGQINPNRAF